MWDGACPNPVAALLVDESACCSRQWCVHAAALDSRYIQCHVLLASPGARCGGGRSPQWPAPAAGLRYKSRGDSLAAGAACALHCSSDVLPMPCRCPSNKPHPSQPQLCHPRTLQRGLQVLAAAPQIQRKLGHAGSAVGVAVCLCDACDAKESMLACCVHFRMHCPAHT